jgi:hypothetical protein
MPRRAGHQDPKKAQEKPPYDAKKQPPPGYEGEMNPKVDHGEESYTGNSRLKDNVAIITEADSGIGRAVAIAFAREGADVVLSYLKEEEEDARETAKWIEDAGRKVHLRSGDVEILQGISGRREEEVWAAGYCCK